MSYPIPKKAIEQHIVVLGKTGRGKSSAMRGGFVEPLLDANEPVCIIDPKGDWFGLRSAADGKRAGYPVVIFGGEHADVPINEHSGPHIAELVATGNRPCIIDLGGLMVGERTRFFIGFAWTLFKLTRGRRWLVIDECHNFAPQGKIIDPDAGKMLHWANKLASEGRGKGINIIAASQRPQKVHKDFLTSMETLIAMGVVHKLDRDAVKDWIDGCADPATGKEVIASLAGLPRGEAWVWSPEINFGPKRIAFPMFKTFDSFKPQAADAGKLKGWAEVDLNDVRAKLATVVEQQRANDPAELKRRIRELEQQLKRTPASVSDAALDHARRQGYDVGYEKGKSRAIEHSAAVLNTLRDDIAGMFSRAVASPVQAASPNIPTVLNHTHSGVTHSGSTRSADGTEYLPPGERATLAACIQFPNGLRREQLTVLTGYKRSSRDAYVQRLRDRGYVETNGARVIATEKGKAAMPNADPLPTGLELQRYWLERLPEGERKILGVLIAAYPRSVQRTQIDLQTGYQRSSRDAYLQRMRAKQLITEPTRGEVRASEDLF